MEAPGKQDVKSLLVQVLVSARAYKQKTRGNERIGEIMGPAGPTNDFSQTFGKMRSLKPPARPYKIDYAEDLFVRENPKGSRFWRRLHGYDRK